MKRKKLIPLLFLAVSMIYSCGDFPMDDDGLLISEQSRCYIGNFFLYGPDHVNVLISDQTVIDTLNLTIDGVARFGSNIRHLKPVASLSPDSKITPAMGVWTDFSGPRKYTVISGNRKIRKEYTITITVEGN